MSVWGPADVTPREAGGARPPFLGKRQATATGDPNLVERSRHCSKAGGADDGFQRVLDTVDLNALRGEALDRRFRDADQLYVRHIVRLEVTGIDSEALADVVGTQQVGRDRILHDAADLPAGEVGDGVIGGFSNKRSP